MTVHKFSNSYYIKKGLLLTVIRIQGTAEASPASPPPYQLRPFFLRLGCLSPPSLLLHVVYRGVPKQLPLTKVLGIQLLKNLSNLLFLCRSAPVHFRNTLCQKMHSLLHQSLTRESFSRSFFRYSFSPFLNKCQLFMLKDFWNLPVNPVWRVPGFMKGGKADNERSNPILLPLVPEFTNI